jgi:hypothetical protein
MAERFPDFLRGSGVHNLVWVFAMHGIEASEAAFQARIV